MHYWVIGHILDDRKWLGERELPLSGDDAQVLRAIAQDMEFLAKKYRTMARVLEELKKEQENEKE